MNNPNTDEHWNVSMKKSNEEATRYVGKWKLDNLHLEPKSCSRMQALIWMAQVQKQTGWDNVIVDQVTSSSWSVSTRAMLKEKTANQVMFNSIVIKDLDIGHSRAVLFSGTASNNVSCDVQRCCFMMCAEWLAK